MKKTVLILLLAVMFVFSACSGSPEPAPQATHSPTIQTPAPPAAQTPDASITEKQPFTAQEVTNGFQADFDGDGTQDTLNIDTTENDYVISTAVSVNDTLLFNEDYILGADSIRVYAADFDKSDPYIDILFHYVNDTEDCFLKIGRYDGAKAVTAAFTSFYGEQPSDALYHVSFDGIDLASIKEGEFNIALRSDLLGTWRYEARMVLQNGYVFSPVIDDFVSMEHLYEEPVSTLEDITAYDDNNDSAGAFTIPKGSKLNFVKTDMEKWVMIDLDGETAWLRFVDESTLRDGEVVYEVFDGLNYAD